LVKEKAAYRALKVLSNPFERERTQLICSRQDFEQYRLPGLMAGVPQEMHLLGLAGFVRLVTLLHDAGCVEI
jgi:hypothetical protein